MALELKKVGALVRFRSTGSDKYRLASQLKSMSYNTAKDEVSFIIGDLIYKNIPISQFVIDNSTPGDQETFETSWSSVFPSPGTGSPSSGSLESFQNDVMQSPVQAYVFRDDDDNVKAVYEPSQNNLAINGKWDTCSTFPFDSPNVTNVTANDVRFLNLGDYLNNGFYMNLCDIARFSIDCGTFGGYFEYCSFTGQADNFPEIGIVGFNTGFNRTTIVQGGKVWRLGESSTVNDCILEGAIIDANRVINNTIAHCHLRGFGTSITLLFDDCTMEHVTCDNYAYFYPAKTKTQFVKLGGRTSIFQSYFEDDWNIVSIDEENKLVEIEGEHAAALTPAKLIAFEDPDDNLLYFTIYNITEVDGNTRFNTRQPLSNVALNHKAQSTKYFDKFEFVTVGAGSYLTIAEGAEVNAIQLQGVDIGSGFDNNLVTGSNRLEFTTNHKNKSFYNEAAVAP